MNDEWKTSAAHHEAGHVIIARSRGITPNYVEIKYNPDLRRWEGTTELPELTGETHEKVISQFAICFAGCFAQVKHAVRSLGSTEPIPWAELLDWTMFRSEQPLKLSLGDGKQFQVPSWWFEGGDKQTFAYLAEKTIDALGGHNFKALLQRAVKHTTVPVLEEIESWRKVEALAASLVGSAVDGVGRVGPAEYT
jgi:hypothetical protein